MKSTGRFWSEWAGAAFHINREEDLFMFRRLLLAFMAAVILALSPLQGDAGVVLVLSGGGIKGFAHLGVMETLELNGVPIVGIVGTSMGDRKSVV